MQIEPGKYRRPVMHFYTTWPLGSCINHGTFWFTSSLKRDNWIAVPKCSSPPDHENKDSKSTFSLAMWQAEESTTLWIKPQRYLGIVLGPWLAGSLPHPSSDRRLSLGATSLVRQEMLSKWRPLSFVLTQKVCGIPESPFSMSGQSSLVEQLHSDAVVMNHRVQRDGERERIKKLPGQQPH